MDTNNGDSSHLKDRLQFLGLDAQGRGSLQQARIVLGDALPKAVDQFYDALARWPSMMAMFSDPSRRQVARDAQVKHWEILFEGHFGPHYLQSVQRIGATHSRIGLEPRWFLGAYARIVSALQASCLEAFAPRVAKDPQARAELSLLLGSIVRATTLDTDLVLEVYFEEGKKQHRLQMQELSERFQTSVSDSLARASADLSAASRQIQASAQETFTQGQAVDASARTAHQNVQSIAAALEEVARSVIEIRGQTEWSTKVAADAVARTKDIDRVMKSLTGAVSRINDGVALINDIAERTNILAINASIEAARAGNVGRGFAVVATEVRTLASQTVDATQAISAQIAALKQASQENQQAVQGIVGVIGTIDKTTAAIAGAVDEQGTVTQETAREAQNVAEQSIAVTQVIAVVTQAAQETGRVAQGLESVLKRMADEFQTLNREAGEFLTRIG